VSAEQVDQLLVKLGKMRKEERRANPEKFWKPEQKRPAQQNSARK
jgi:hypothetical protein